MCLNTGNLLKINKKLCFLKCLIKLQSGENSDGEKEKSNRKALEHNKG